MLNVKIMLVNRQQYQPPQHTMHYIILQYSSLPHCGDVVQTTNCTERAGYYSSPSQFRWW